MENKERTKISEFMSLVLRHKPETIDLTLDSNGWTKISDLKNKMCQNSPYKPSTSDILYIVDQCDKKRFEVYGALIRASQGHSIDVDLDYQEMVPPDILYHGTSTHNYDLIMKSKSISKMNRHAISLYEHPTYEQCKIAISQSIHVIGLIRNFPDGIIEEYFENDNLTKYGVQNIIDKTKQDHIKIYLKMKWGDLI